MKAENFIFTLYFFFSLTKASQPFRVGKFLLARDKLCKTLAVPRGSISGPNLQFVKRGGNRELMPNPLAAKNGGPVVPTT